MRVLLSTLGSHGDVRPLPAFAIRLREFGEQVRLCACRTSTTWSTASSLRLVLADPRSRDPDHIPQGAMRCDSARVGLFSM